MLFLPWDFGGETMELALRLVDLAMDFGALPRIEGHRGAHQAPVLPARDGHHHLQIAQQLGDEGRGRIGGTLPLHFQKQLGVFQDPLSNASRGVSPSGIQLPRFATGEVVLRKRLGHAWAVLGAGTRHRHQEFHGYMGRDRALAYLLLHALREPLYKRQPARHPTHTAVKPARQLLQAVAETLLELRQQPAFFQSAVLFRPTQRAIQHQGFRFAQRPDHGLDRIAAELFQSHDALIPVNDQIAIRLIWNGDHDDRCLLSRGGQRGQQLPLPLPIPRPQKFIPAIQLVKFQLHSRPYPQTAGIFQQVRSGIAPVEGEVCREVLANQRDKPGTGIAHPAARVSPEPQ
jgi:hypothetical protein